MTARPAGAEAVTPGGDGAERAPEDEPQGLGVTGGEGRRLELGLLILGGDLKL